MHEVFFFVVFLVLFSQCFTTRLRKKVQPEDTLNFHQDMTWNEAEKGFNYSCPCGDLFFISLQDMIRFDEEVATCPSCSLILRYGYLYSFLT